MLELNVFFMVVVEDEESRIGGEFSLALSDLNSSRVSLRYKSESSAGSHLSICIV